MGTPAALLSHSGAYSAYLQESGRSRSGIAPRSHRSARRVTTPVRARPALLSEELSEEGGRVVGGEGHPLRQIDPESLRYGMLS